jgi:hypothetical protein
LHFGPGGLAHVVGEADIGIMAMPARFHIEQTLAERRLAGAEGIGKKPRHANPL